MMSHSRLRSSSAAIALQVLLFAVMGGASLYAKVTLNPIQDSVGTALRLSDNQISIVQGIVASLPMVVLWAPLGRMIDRTSRVQILRILLTLCCIGCILTSFATGFVSLCIARSLVGCASMAMVPVVYSLAANAVPERFRGRANIAVAIGQSAGMGASFLLAALLSRYLAIDVAWRTVSRIMVLPLLLMLVVACLMSEPVKEAADGVVDAEASSMSFILARYRYVLLIIAGENCAEICLGAMLIWGVPLFNRGLGMGIGAAGSTAGVIFLAGGIVGATLGGALVDMLSGRGRATRALSVLGGLSLFTGLCGVAMLSRSPVIGVSAFTCLFVVASATTTAALTSIANAVPQELRGTALSLWCTCAMVFGMGFAPLAASLTAGFFAGPGAIGMGLAIVCAAFGATGGLMFWMADRGWSHARQATDGGGQGMTTVVEA